MTGRPGGGQLGVFLRFVLVNALNTGLYWGLYLLLLPLMPYFAANAVALVVAVLVAYVANARYAFRVGTSRRSLVLYALTNGTTILLRMAVVWVAVDLLGLAESLAPPVAVVVTTPIAFVLTKWAMAERGADRPAAVPAPAVPAPRADGRPQAA
ncbi:GtrA family protein [Geodermatophilus sp. SYSU D00815]